MTKVLIADDEPNIVMSLDFLMRKAKYEVFIARDGQEALDLAQQEQPDLILLDIMMPEMNGYEVFEQLKQNPNTQHCKVIFMSAKGKEEDIKKGLALGASLYVTKPFSTRNLMKQVKQLLK